MFKNLRNWVNSIFTSGTLVFNQPSTYAQNINANRSHPFYSRLNRRNRPYAKLRLEGWQQAIQMAENVDQPRREVLYDLYKASLNDDTLLSEIRKAHIMVQRSPFMVERQGKANDKLKDLFMKPWFKVFLRHWLDAEFWGHSLVEFNPNMVEGEFQSIELIPREHVRPEFEEVVMDTSQQYGLSFEKAKKEYGAKLVPIGEPFDLGLLRVASKSVIIKNYSISDWSQFNEKFGMPITVIKSSSRNEEELNVLEDMAKNMGSNGYGIFDDMDTVELIERKGQMSHKTYDDLITRKDNGISKLINGQTGTSDEKAYVGSANVHERTMNDYTFSRLSNCQDFINYVLIPFLIENGYPLKAKWDKFLFTELVNTPSKNDNGQPTKDGNTPPNAPTPTNPNTTEGGQKKKPVGKLSFDDVTGRDVALQRLYGQHGCCTTEGVEMGTLDFNLSDLFQKAIDKVFRKKKKAGFVDAALWKATVDELTKAIDEGFGTEYKDATDTDLATELKSNIAVFAAFKNYAQNAELVDNLRDADGNLKSYNQFRKDATTILTKFNENWLQAEYQTAVASARMAVQWNDFQRDKDVFPNLMYVTAGDERVRKAHAALDGVTLPIDDPFWSQWFPPNGWRCRCDVQPVGANARLKQPKSLPSEEESPLMFRNNVGTTGKVFTDEHPYIATLSDEQKDNVMKTVNKLLSK
jgi:SPP1 gp7 family putative phage head morphogenesis protein